MDASELVERVARALCGLENKEADRIVFIVGQDGPQPLWRAWEHEARAALREIVAAAGLEPVHIIVSASLLEDVAGGDNDLLVVDLLRALAAAVEQEARNDR